VVMEMERATTEDIIKKDSIAAIKTEGLVGNKYVEISFGSKDAEKVKDGDTIGTEPPLEIADLVKKSGQILDNFASVTSKIDQGTGAAGAFINDKSLYTHANAATAEAKAGATAFHENMEALKGNFFLRGFFRRRGYEDSDELKKHTISKLPSGPYVQKFSYDASQIFAKPAAAKLKNERTLNEAGKFLEENKFGLAVIAAHSGMKGDTEKERQLTEARSMVVRDYLTQNFRLDDTRIKTIGLGKTSEAGDSGGVEILIYPAGSNLAVTQNQPARR